MRNILILAGNKAEFDRYCRDHEEDLRDWSPLYPTRVESFMGMRGADYITFGTFWERPDASKMYDAAKKFCSLEN